jgi:hypothetical protein
MISDGYWCVATAWPGDLSREIYLGGYRAGRNAPARRAMAPGAGCLARQWP